MPLYLEDSVPELEVGHFAPCEGGGGAELGLRVNVQAAVLVHERVHGDFVNCLGKVPRNKV